MAKEIITARIDPEDNVAITHLVESGVFSNPSDAVQVAIKLLLTYCNMEESLSDISSASEKFRERASLAAAESAAKSMVTLVIAELTSLIEVGEVRPIADALNRTGTTANELPEKLQQLFYENLSAEPVFTLAKRMVGK